MAPLGPVIVDSRSSPTPQGEVDVINRLAMSPEQPED